MKIANFELPRYKEEWIAWINYFLRKTFYRPPNVKIQRDGKPYLDRWHIIPRNRFFNIYLHHFLQSDHDEALHDHPWCNVSLLLTGGYTEWVPVYAKNTYYYEENIKPIRRSRRGVVFRFGSSAHRIELDRDENGNEIPIWTLFITGPKYREWGFYCKSAWTHWINFDTFGGCSDD